LYRWARRFEFIDFCRRAHAEVRPTVALRKVAAAPHDFADLRDSAGGKFQASAQRVTIALRVYQLEANAVIAITAAIVKPEGRTVVAGYHHVHETIVIEIGESGGPTWEVCKASPEFFETSVAVSLQQDCF